MSKRICTGLAALAATMLLAAPSVAVSTSAAASGNQVSGDQVVRAGGLGCC